MQAAVFLDRDGVLNRPMLRDGRGYAPKTVEDFEILPGVGDAVERLKSARFPVIVVTNQRDVGRGQTSWKVLNEMHRILRESVPVDDILVCTCTGNCPCYKPSPGMLLEAAATWGLDLRASVVVGDTWRDVGAGKAVGAKTILINWGYTTGDSCAPDATVDNLMEAVSLILQDNR